MPPKKKRLGGPKKRRNERQKRAATAAVRAASVQRAPSPRRAVSPVAAAPRRVRKAPQLLHGRLIPMTVTKSEGRSKRDLVAFHILRTDDAGNPLSAYKTAAGDAVVFHTSTPAAAARKAINRVLNASARPNTWFYVATAARVHYGKPHPMRYTAGVDSRSGWTVKIWRGVYRPGPERSFMQKITKGENKGKIQRTFVKGGRVQTNLLATYSVPFNALTQALRAVAAVRNSRVSRATMLRAFKSDRSFANLKKTAPSIFTSSGARAGGGSRPVRRYSDDQYDDQPQRRYGGDCGMRSYDDGLSTDDYYVGGNSGYAMNYGGYESAANDVRSAGRSVYRSDDRDEYESVPRRHAGMDGYGDDDDDGY